MTFAWNGRAFLYPSHEVDTSFGIAIDLDTIEMLTATEPETYWPTSHYEGWPGVPVRYDARDEARVREMIARSRDYAASLPKASPRKRK